VTATPAAATADPLLRRNPAHAVLAQGLPLALGLASHAAINLVDLAMVGRLGGDAVQAAHVGSTWNFLPMIVGNCVSTALLARLSRLLGRGQRDEAQAFNRRAQWFMLWLGIALALATALPAAPMVAAMGVGASVRADAIHYLVVSNLGCVPMFVLMQTTAAMRAAGESAMPLALLLGANAINLLLALPLLFGWQALGIESVGVVGAAYAAAAARTLGALAAWWWLWRRGHALTLRRPVGALAGAGGRPRVVGPLLADAWPQTLQIALRAGLVLLLTPMVAHRLGDSGLVAFGIVTRFDTLVLFASLGFANAATAYAGRAVVVGRPGAARAAGVWAAVQAGLFGAALVAAMVAAPALWVGLCMPSRPAEVVANAELYFETAAWAQVAGAVALGAMGAVQGAGNMRAPLLVDLVGFAVVYALLLGPWLPPGDAAALFTALVAGMVVVAALQIGLAAWGGWARPDSQPTE
jgi:MATE family multidrug resistance protein